MNVRKENYWDAIIGKLRAHEQVACSGINCHDRRRARTNLIRLSNKYPEAAKQANVCIPTPAKVKAGPQMPCASKEGKLL